MDNFFETVLEHEKSATEQAFFKERKNISSKAFKELFCMTNDMIIQKNKIGRYKDYRIFLMLMVRNCFRELYFLRWGIENAFDILKNKLLEINRSLIIVCFKHRISAIILYPHNYVKNLFFYVHDNLFL